MREIKNKEEKRAAKPNESTEKDEAWKVRENTKVLARRMQERSETLL